MYGQDRVKIREGLGRVEYFRRIFVQVFFFNLGTTGGASIEEIKTGGVQHVHR